MVALAALIGSGVAAGAAVSRAELLLPLTRADMNKVDEVGCIVSFSSNRRTLFYAVGSTMTLRTRTGASICTLPERAFGTFSQARGGVTCNGTRLALKPLGRIVSDEAADGSSQRVTLTVGTGTAATVLRGEVSTAC